MSSAATGSGEHFSLVWNTFPRNLSSGLYNLFTCEQLVDVTLAAEGRILRAHKLILSVCSSYFRELFKGNTCKHPIVILKDVNYRDLSAMLQFMYQGEVSIKQEDIGSFLKVAEILKIKGLTRTCDDDDETEKNLVDALPPIHHERSATNNNVSAIQTTQSDSSYCDPTKPWSSASPCSCATSKPTPKEDISIRTSFSESSDTFIPEAHTVPVDDMEDDEPLDCSSAAPEDMQKKQQQQQQQQQPQQQQEFPEYKVDISLMNPEIRHLTPEVECIQRPAIVTAGVVPHSEQENMDTMLNARHELMPAYGAPPTAGHCQGDSVGFHDTGTTCASSDYSHDPTASCSNTGSSKGRRTVKGLPSSSLSLETTLRVISELGPTIRMERGKVIRMYSCPWCLRHFTRKENLKLHVRYIHGPLESLTCKLCGNKYKNSNSLRVHSYLYHNAQRNSKTSSSTSSGGGGGAGGSNGGNNNKPPIVGGNA